MARLFVVVIVIASFLLLGQGCRLGYDERSGDAATETDLIDVLIGALDTSGSREGARAEPGLN